MKEKINILITGSGSPGISGTVYSLKKTNNFVEIKIIGTDINSCAVGKYLCDYFFVIPPCSDEKNYLNALLDICKNEKVRIIIPQNTLELNILSKNRDIFGKINVDIMVSNQSSIEQSNNKFHLLELSKKIGIPVPKFYLVDNLVDLKTTMESLGWPQKRIVIKPPVSNGSRGVRIIDETKNLENIFYFEKPGSLFTNFSIISKILSSTFEKLLVMEFIEGEEYTVDFLKTDSSYRCIPRSRNEIKNGITFSGEVVKNNLIEEYSLILSRKLNLLYCFGFQFIMQDNIPYIIECNPRVQGSMVISTLANANIILDSVLHILKKPIKPGHINYGTKFVRYWGGFSENNNEVIKI